VYFVRDKELSDGACCTTFLLILYLLVRHTESICYIYSFDILQLLFYFTRVHVVFVAFPLNEPQLLFRLLKPGKAPEHGKKEGGDRGQQPTGRHPYRQGTPGITGACCWAWVGFLTANRKSSPPIVRCVRTSCRGLAVLTQCASRTGVASLGNWGTLGVVVSMYNMQQARPR
jgi:hypothetical protein